MVELKSIIMNFKIGVLPITYAYSFMKKEKYEILVADNSELSVRIIKEILDGMPDDIELYSAKDGKTACEIASELIPDLILMDVLLPEMDGFTATREIKSFARKVI